MGNYACYEDTVEETSVKEQSPEQFQNLLDALEEANLSLKAFAAVAGGLRGVDIEVELEEDVLDEKLTRKISNAFDALCLDFNNKTGLDLGIGFKEAEDRGDEVDGVYWCVGGVYELTKAGKKWESKIERKFWTNFG